MLAPFAMCEWCEQCEACEFLLTASGEWRNFLDLFVSYKALTLKSY